MRSLITFAAAALLVISCPGGASAQFNNNRSSGRTTSSSGSARQQTSVFNQGRAGNFNDYRVSLNAEYARQIKEYEWKQQQMKGGKKAPDRDVKPVDPVQWDKNREQGKKGKEVVIEEVVNPINRDNKAKPIAPVTIPEGDNSPGIQVPYLGTTTTVHGPSGRFTLGSLSQSAIADGWTRLSQPEYAHLVADCIKYKSQAKLCDWAFFTFLEQVARQTASGSDAVALMMAYLASQAGYDIRLAIADNSRLDMAFGSQHVIYDRPYIVNEGTSYHPYFTKNAKTLALCQSRFKNETGVSLWIPTLPPAAEAISENRTIKSKRYPEFAVTSSVNKNLISFYDTYPTSSVGSNAVTRWAMYANTPISDHVRQTLYPQLRKLIAGQSPLEAVQRILNWIQTGFVYEYDDKVWGGDRAFFPEESLYYPYCDCEDRSILLTRLVRDLLGLKCLLVFYPGHLAAAINFPGEVQGDYIVHGGQKFTVTDPTYIGAPVGRTMPKMDNSTAKIILLN